MAWFYTNDPPLHRDALETSTPRVVSFLGAATEIVCLLGCEKSLVGRSHECRRPESILSLPCVSSAEPIGDDLGALSSREIDERVRGLVERGLARYKIDAEMLRDLQPDVILTQDQCSVCAVTPQDLESACSRFFHEDQKPCKVVSLRPTTMSDVWDNVRIIADALNVSEKGEALVKSLQADWDSIRRNTPQYNDGMFPLSVACLQWTDPLIGAGYWVPEIVSCAGGLNLLGEKGGGSPKVTLESLAEARPEVIVVMCCGLGLDRGVKDVEALEKQAGWAGLRAVRNGRVYVVNGDEYFNTSSAAAAVESARLMAEILHGGRSGLEGSAYVRRPAIAPSTDISSDVSAAPRPAAPPRRPPPLPTWLQGPETSSQSNGGHFPGGSHSQQERGGVNGHAQLDSPRAESPVSTPGGSGFRLFESAAGTPPWGGSPMGSSPGAAAPPEEREDFWTGNDSDEEGWTGNREVVLGGFSDSESDSDDEFESLVEVPLAEAKWSLERGGREEGGSGAGLGLTQGLVLDSELDAIAEGARRQASGERRCDVSEAEVTSAEASSKQQRQTEPVSKPAGVGYGSRAKAQPLAVPKRGEFSFDTGPAGYPNYDLNPPPEPKSWQEPRVLSPDSLRSSPTRWPSSHPPTWPETPKTPQTPSSMDEFEKQFPFDFARGKKQTESNPSRFAEEAGFGGSEEKESGSEKEESGRGEEWLKDGSKSRSDKAEDSGWGVRGAGIVPPRLKVETTGLTVFEGPHSPLESPGPHALVNSGSPELESVSLESPRDDAERGVGSAGNKSPLEGGGGDHSAFKRLRPAGRPLSLDVSKWPDADVIPAEADVITPPPRPSTPPPVSPPPPGELVSPMASRPGFMANLLETQTQTSPPLSPIRTPPLLRASPPRSPSSPPNFHMPPIPSDLPALMDLGSVPALKTLSPIRTGRQFTPVPTSPPFAPAEPPRGLQNVPALDLPRSGGQSSPSPPSSPSLSPLSSPLGNGRLRENGYRPPKSPSSPQALASPRFSPLSVLPYLNLDASLDPWSNPKTLDPAELVEETGLEPMETLGGESGYDADVNSLEDSIRGSMDRWMWGEIGMEGVAAAAGLDNVQSMGAEISAEAGPATDADAPASGTSEGVRTASERVRTASEGVSADPQGVRTAPEGVRKASEDVRTALDDVCTGTEEISSDPRAVRTGPEGVEPASESGRTSLEGVRTTPEGVRTTLDGVRMRPLTAKAEELRTVLEEAVEAALPADCIILSGGLDTCVLAELAAAGAGNGMDGNGMDTSETGANGISAVTEGGSKAKQEQREHGENSEDPLKRSEEHRRAEVRIHIQQPISDSTARPASISAPPANSGSVTDQSGSYDNRPEHMDVSSAYAADRQTTGDISREGEKQSADMAPRIKEALTVLTGEHATDRPYAEEIAKRCGLRHTVIETRTPEALLDTELEFVVRTLRTFDPMEVRNSIAVAAALREAHRRGHTSAITGDGADELLGGYSFTHGLSPEKFAEYRTHLRSIMRFSAVPLGAALGIEVRQPYLFPKFVDHALASLARENLVGPVPPELLTEDVRRGIERTCRTEDLARLGGETVHGKLALREAFPGVYAAWRSKDPIEVGCGTTVLPARFKEALSEADLAAAQKTIRELDRVRIRDAEHLHYYRAFRTVFGPGDPPGMVRWGPDPCVACGYELQQPSQMFCVVCGEYPARKPAGGERKDGAGGGGKGGSNGGGGQSAKGVMGGKGNSGGIGERKEGETEEGGLRSGGEGTATGDAQESVSARGGAQSLANEGGASSMVGRETRNGGKETAGANRPQLLVADVSVPGFDKSLERNNSSERVVGSGGQRESPKFLAPVSRTSSADSNEDYASADEYFDESDG